MKYFAIVMFFVLSPLAGAAEQQRTPMILGAGTNLAHWLSQTRRTGAERRQFIVEEDIAYIAELGFDHVRLPLDEQQMWAEDGTRDDDAFEALAKAVACGWADPTVLQVDEDFVSLRHEVRYEKAVLDLLVRSRRLQVSNEPSGSM